MNPITGILALFRYFDADKQGGGATTQAQPIDFLHKNSTTLYMNQNLHRTSLRDNLIMNRNFMYLTSFRHRWTSLLAVLLCFVLPLNANNNPFDGNNIPLKPGLSKNRVITTHKGFTIKEQRNAKAFRPLAGVDLGISKSASHTSAAIGDVVTFTLKVYNEGTADATNVMVKDSVPAGTTYMSSTPAAAYSAATRLWNVGTVAVGDTLTFTYTVQIVSDGVTISEAEVFSMTETDMDSTPNDGNPSEDDWASACISIPMYFCNTNQIQIDVEAPLGFTSYKWYKDGLQVATSRTYTISDFGDYHYEANTNTAASCPVELCCPIQVKQKCMALGNIVWNDTNNNGIKDGTETGIEGIEVVLYNAGANGKDATDVIVATQNTGAAGQYSFDNLPEGIYYVKLTGTGIPSGMVSSNGTGTPYTAGNGAYEPGVTGVNEEDNGTQMGTMIMSDLITMTYDQAPTSDGDTDPNTNLTVDFGLHKPILPAPLLSLGNLVWNDTNNDGIKDGTETGISGVEVVLYNAGADGKDATDVIVATKTTGANGDYLFDNLPEGVYYVKLTGTGIPSGMVSSNGKGTPYTTGTGDFEPGVTGIDGQDNGTQMGIMIMSDTIRLTANLESTSDGDTDPNTDLTVDFGLHLPVAPLTLSIGNLVWKDLNNNGHAELGEPGLEGVEVVLYDAGPDGKDATDVIVATKTTDTNGNYLFDGLVEGNYYVKLTGNGIPEGLYSSTGDGNDDDDFEGLYEPAISSDTSNNYDNGTIMGTMVMSDVVELVIDEEPITDGDTNPNTNLTIDFGFFRPDTFDLALTKRLADGQTNIVVPGDTLIYALDVKNTGNVDASSVSVVDYLPADLILADTNWIDIGGVVVLVNPIPFIAVGESVTVNIVTIINPDFQGGVIANYATVDEPLDSIPDNNLDTIKIEVRKKLLSLGDLVWNDLDNDGKYDPSETGIQGVTLELYNAGDDGKDATDTLKATTTTDADGFYLFQNLQAGNYYVKITGGVPADMISSTGNGASDPGTNGDYEPSNLTDANEEDNGTQMGTMIMSGIVVLEYDNEPLNDGDNNSTTNLTVDFGLYKPVLTPAGLSGKAFVDCNNNGISTGDSPLAGITVALSGDATMNTTTDANGVFSFGSLAAGTYKLTFGTKTGLTYTTQDQGSDDAIDSDIDAATGMTANFTLIAGQNATYDAGYKDGIAPVFTNANTVVDITVECDAVPTAATLLATDTYDTNVTITPSEVKTNGSCSENYVLVRTWTASDDCGNQAQHTQTITVRDTEAPIFDTTPVIADLTVNCGEVPNLPTGVKATDNCDIDVAIAFVENKLDGACANNYTLVRTWTASDNCSNQTPLVQRITVRDNTAPTFTSADVSDITASCNAVPSPAIMTATDLCDNDVSIVFTNTKTTGTCEDTYVVTNTWTATDNCGNTVQRAQRVTVQDVTPPVFANVPTSVTINCGQGVPTAPTATDACDANVEITMVETAATGDCATGRSITRTFTAVDNCGNRSTFVQTVYVIDTEAPALTGVPASVTVNCKDVPPPTKITVKDNCPDAVMVMFDEQKTAGDNCTGFTITRTWTAMDACGNTASYVQNIVIEGDHAAPTIAGVPANVDYDCVDVIPAPTTPTASDDCDNSPKITYTEDKLGDGCGYKLVRIWTATDKCGNTSTKDQVITVRDRTAPIITSVPSDITVDCADALPTVATPVASDACDNSTNLTFVETVVGDKNACQYQVIRTWTATDKCGNSTNKAQTITVRDTKAPTVTPNHPMLAGVPNGGSITIECEGDLVVMDEDDATAADNCDKNPTIKFEEYDAKKGDCAVDGYSYTITCRWTATDKCGNSSSFSFKVIVKDTKAPVFANVPANMTINCDETVPSSLAPTVSDACDKTVNVAYNELKENGACANSYTLRRTWVATDDCGNKSTATQTINVIDNKAPIISNVPTGVVVACGQTPAAGQRPTVADNCDNAPTLTYVDAPSTTGGCLGSIIRTWTASDACGNVATANQTITIEDKTPPALVGVPSNVSGVCDYTTAAPNVTATDNCDTNVTVTFKEDKQGTGCNYTLVRTWTATDKCGNTNTASQTISVEDRVAPVLVGVPSNVSGVCDYTTAAPNVTATDNCDTNVKVELKEDKQGTGCNYTLVRTWTATDKCGNTSTASQTISVEDRVAPVLVGVPANIDASCDYTATAPSVTATDNCDTNVKVELKEDKIGTGCRYKLVRTWTATDKCGNTAEASQVVNISDDIAPVISVTFGDVTVNCKDLATAYGATATDNCDTDVTITATNVKVGTGCNYVMRRTYTATDDCGNTATKVQNITIEDKDGPVITFNDPILAAAKSGDTLTFSCDKLPAYSETTANATDDCSGVLVVKDNNRIEFTDKLLRQGNCLSDGYLNLLYCEWKATDSCGNVTKWFMYAKVVDNKAPVLAAIPDDITLTCDATTPVLPNVTATDNCTASPKVTLVETPISTGGCTLAGSVLRTWTATDDCGNSTSKSQRVVISDTEKPEILGVPTADITIGENDEEPVVNIKATDKCDPSVTVKATATKTTNGCDEVTTHTVMATDKCGNVATAMYHVVRKVSSELVANISVITTADICSAKNGSVVMTPANYTYTWADGFIGANRPNLAAGSYNVTVTDGTCATKVTTVTIDSDCPVTCTKPELGTFTATDTDCGQATGSITFSMKDGVAADYSYAWSTPNGSATSANNLAEGQYFVTVSRTSNVTCSDVFTFKVNKKATDLNQNLTISTKPDSCGTKNGLVIMTPVSYTYTWADGFVGATRKDLTAGNYSITITDGACGDLVKTVTVAADCPTVTCTKPTLDSNNITDAGCNGSDSGSIVFTLKDGVEADYTFVWSTPLGKTTFANGLKEGAYAVTVTRVNDATCSSVFTFNVGTKTNRPIFSSTTETFTITDCANGKASLCTTLTPTDVNAGNYTITDNGAPYTGTFKGCKFDTSFFYKYSYLAGAGLNGPYVLTGWSINGQVYDGEFANATELIALMNGWDVTGNWKLTAAQTIAGGDKSKFYGKMDIRLKNNASSTAILDLDTRLTPYAMAMQLGEGTHIIEAKSNDGCVSNVKVTVTCTPPPPTCKSFINWESENVYNCVGAGKLCIEELPFAQITDVNITDNGSSYVGGTAACLGGGTQLTLTNGVHQLIFVKKDGCRDTMVVKVYCTSTRLIQEKIYVGQKDTVCLDVAELLGNIKDIKNIWPSKSGEHAQFELLAGSRCITCTGMEAGGMDEAAYVITDEHGIQDTTIFQITVLERKDATTTPEAVSDQGVGKEGEVMILDVLANDKLAGQKLTEIKITEQPKNGFVFVNQDKKVVFTPKPGFCDDENDEFFSYKICTVGGCDDAPVTIRVLCSNIKVFTGFSPNNDGVNDTFVIEGLGVNPDNHLTIFNRYGNQVYTKEGYRNDWNGTWNGNNLPDGTYFYLFEDGKGNTKAGYVQIQR